MDFYEVLDHVVALLEKRGRVAYRALKVQFKLDDESLEALKDELIDAQRLAVDEDAKVLVWTGKETSSSASQPAPPHSQSHPPVSYTPPHLAERILAEQAAMESRGSANGERKTITALFADLKDVKTLLDQLS